MSLNDRARLRSQKKCNAGQLCLGVDEVDAFRRNTQLPIDPSQAVLNQCGPGALEFETILEQDERRGTQ